MRWVQYTELKRGPVAYEWNVGGAQALREVLKTEMNGQFFGSALQLGVWYRVLAKDVEGA